MKHTPGPWEVGNTSLNGFISIRSSDQRTVCSVLPQLPTETADNAKLLAAAPEIYIALKKWHQFMLDNYTPEDISWWFETCIALSKVDGTKVLED